MHADRSVVEALCKSLRDGRVDDAVALLAPSFQATLAEGLPLGLGGEYHGPGEMRRGVYEAVGAVYELGPVVDELLSVEPGRLVVVGRYVGAARATGLAINARFVWLVRVDRDQLTELIQVTDTALWRQALGESDPQPDGGAG
jgi:hypothetical protein